MTIMTPQVRQEHARQTPLRRAVHVATTEILTTATTLITADDDTDVLIESLWVADETSSADTISLYMVPDGGTAAAGNAMVTDLAIAGNSITWICTRDQTIRLQPGYSLQATATTAGRINVGGWGYAIGGEG